MRPPVAETFAFLPTPSFAHLPAALAHDAGNVLAAFRLYCDLLESPGVLAPRHRHYVAELRRLFQRSDALLRDTQLCPADSPGISSQHSCNPAQVLQALLPVLKGIASPTATVTLRLAAAGVTVPRLSEQTLERIVVNLVRNAAQAIAAATPSSSPRPIRIALKRTPDHLQLTVQDGGPGMRLDAAASFIHPEPLPMGSTSGFGHRIIHQLAAESGANLSLHVRRGLGCTFCLQWPLPAFSGASSSC